MTILHAILCNSFSLPSDPHQTAVQLPFRKSKINTTCYQQQARKARAGTSDRIAGIGRRLTKDGIGRQGVTLSQEPAQAPLQLRRQDLAPTLRRPAQVRRRRDPRTRRRPVHLLPRRVHQTDSQFSFPFFLFGMTMTVVAMMMLAELKERIKEMFNIAEVVIKHQIMPEDLDLLVSVTCDEDLRHMLDEYDRHDSRCPSNSPRFRLFLFSSVPPRLAPFSDAAASSIEQRYLEAINGVPPSAGLSLFAISTSAATSPTSNTNLRHPFLAAQTNHLSTSAGGGQGLHRVQSTPHLGQGLHRVRSTPNLGVATRSQMANGMGPPYGGQHQQQHPHHHHYHDGLQAQPSAYGGGGGGPWRTESGPVRYVACGCGCGCRVAQPPPHAARSGGCVCLGHVDDPGAAFPPRTGSAHSFPLVVPRRSPRPTSWE